MRLRASADQGVLHASFPDQSGWVTPLSQPPVKNNEEGRMTKADLIDEVSRLAELTRKASEVIEGLILDSVGRSLGPGDKIEIRGFGRFVPRQRKPRVGRNP